MQLKIKKTKQNYNSTDNPLPTLCLIELASRSSAYSQCIGLIKPGDIKTIVEWILIHYLAPLGKQFTFIAVSLLGFSISFFPRDCKSN